MYVDFVYLISLLNLLNTAYGQWSYYWVKSTHLITIVILTWCEGKPVFTQFAVFLAAVF